MRELFSKKLHGKFGEICMFTPVCWRELDGLWGKIASHPNFDTWTAPYCLRMLGCLGTGHPDYPQCLKMVFVSSNHLHPSKNMSHAMGMDSSIAGRMVSFQVGSSHISHLANRYIVQLPAMLICCTGVLGYVLFWLPLRLSNTQIKNPTIFIFLVLAF